MGGNEEMGGGGDDTGGDNYGGDDYGGAEPNQEFGGGGAEPAWEFGGGVRPLPVLVGAYDTFNAPNNGGGAEPANENYIEQYNMMMQNQSSLADHRGGSGA